MVIVTVFVIDLSCLYVTMSGNCVLLSVLINVVMHRHTNGYFEKNNAGLTDVPHNMISSDETNIQLESNKISTLAADEFSGYPNLIELNLARNELQAVSSTAFSGTKLEILSIASNRDLTELPDLSAIRTTLKSLVFWNNGVTVIPRERLDLPQLTLLALSYSGLTQWPDFSLVGTGTAEEKTLAIKNGVNLPTMDTTSAYCNFEIINRNDEPSHVPVIPCDPDSSALNNLKLDDKAFNDLTDLSNLTSLGSISSFERLSLSKNGFTVFPNLPLVLRQKLKVLSLKKCKIAWIPDEVVQGYLLDELDIANNKLVTFPYQLLSITASLSMAGIITFNDWSPSSWGQIFCNELYFGLTNILLSGTISNAVHYAAVDVTSCNRTQNITIDLTKVSAEIWFITVFFL